MSDNYFQGWKDKLFMAIHMGRVDLVRAALSKIPADAVPDLRENNKSPRELALEKGNSEIIDLLSSGAAATLAAATLPNLGGTQKAAEKGQKLPI